MNWSYVVTNRICSRMHSGYLMIIVLVLAICEKGYSQIGIGTLTPHASAALDVHSSTRGLLMPRMTTSTIQTLTGPAKGLMMFDSISNQFTVNMGTPWTPDWKNVVAKSSWGLSGNQGIDPELQFIGHTDNRPIQFRINNIRAGKLDEPTGSIFWGLRAGLSNTTGGNNIAIGTDALRNNFTSDFLIALGDSTLYSLDSCNYEFEVSANIAIGSKSLFSTLCADRNTATGYHTMVFNTEGFQNTAFGASALYRNTIGNYNTGMGSLALFSNMNGSANTGVGSTSLYLNTTGIRNTGIGSNALQLNIQSNYNTAAGANALQNSNSHYNTAVGYQALIDNSGTENTAIGHVAGNSYVPGSNNILIGAGADISFSNQTNSIALGEGVVCPDNNTIRIGNSATWSIGGYADWTNFSDGRYKMNIDHNIPGLDFINRLRPVTYQLDVRRLSQDTGEDHGERNIYIDQAFQEKEEVMYSGFIAQEVEEAAAHVGFTFSGVDKPRNEHGPYGLRYATFVVPLVKAVQELNAENQMLKSILQEQQLILDKYLIRVERLKNARNYNQQSSNRE